MDIDKNKNRINDNIHAKEVRLLGNNVEMDIYPIKEALQIADELDLDLVEISPNAKPPVCKVMDYNKFVYEQRRRRRANQANTSKVVVKEIRFGPNTDDHDYECKKNHAIKFRKEGSK